MHKQIKAWAIPLQRQLGGEMYLHKPVFSPRPVCAGFVVDRVVLGHSFLRVLRFFRVSIIAYPCSLLVH